MSPVSRSKKTTQRNWAAKVCRPAALSALPRERLYVRLDEGRARPVLWVSGPAGCGKTTLVSGYVEARKIPCLWYRVDAGDADLPTFFHYLRLCAQRLAPKSASALPHLTPEYLSGLPEFSRNFFESVFARVPSPCLLVFDNYQTLPAGAALHSLLLESLTRMPETVNIVIISRHEPLPDFARLRANRTMELLGWRDLRLTLEEIEAIVALEKRVTLPADVLARLHERLGGWVAGLQLVSTAAAQGEIELDTVDDTTPEHIFDYFAGEIFARHDEDTRGFLLKTSFLPSMTASAAQELTGYPAADRLLSFLHRHNHFTEKRLSPQPEYQYHPLFRGFLAERARSCLPPQERAAIQRKAAGLLAQMNQPEEAARLLCDAEDWGGLIEWIEGHADLLVTQGRAGLLEQWLHKLPAPLVEEAPWLLYWLGECRLPFDPPEARESFEKAYGLFRAGAADRTGILLSWAGVVDSILSGLEDYAQLDPWIATLCETMDGPETLPGEGVGRRVASSMYAALAVRQPRHADFGRWEACALDVARHAPDIETAVQILTHAAFCRVYRGDLAGAELVLQEAKRRAESKRASPLGRLRSLFAEAFFCNAAGSFPRVGELTEEALKLADATGIHAMDFMILSNGVRGALNGDDLPRAAQMWERLATLPLPQKRWTQCFQQYLSSALALREGRVDRATLCAQAAVEAAASAGVCYAEAASRLLLAEALQESGEQSQAAESLAEGERLAYDHGYVQLLLNARLAAARAAFERLDEAEGVAALRRALSGGAQNGGVVPYLCRAPALSELCAQALRHGVEAPYARDLIARCSLSPRAPGPDAEEWPWPVKIYTLGRFEVWLRGAPLRFQGKAQKKPLALLKALVAFGGSGVSESQLTGALWPDADGALAHSSFTSTLHRLRRLLGERDAIELRDGALGFDPRRCWVDVWALDNLLAQTEPTGGMDIDSGATEKAVALYRGSFLPQDSDAWWALSPRQRLRARFVRAVGDYGQRLETAGQWAQAAAFYQKAIESDPLAEELYRRLIECEQRRGRRAEALAIYERCRRLLRKSLGVDPSPETEKLGERLRAL